MLCADRHAWKYIDINVEKNFITKVSTDLKKINIKITFDFRPLSDVIFINSG